MSESATAIRRRKFERARDAKVLKLLRLADKWLELPAQNGQRVFAIPATSETAIRQATSTWCT